MYVHTVAQHLPSIVKCRPSVIKRSWGNMEPDHQPANQASLLACSFPLFKLLFSVRHSAPVPRFTLSRQPLSSFTHHPSPITPTTHLTSLQIGHVIAHRSSSRYECAVVTAYGVLSSRDFDQLRTPGDETSGVQNSDDSPYIIEFTDWTLWK